MPSGLAPIAEVQAWFQERGFRLELREESGRFWADLVSLATQSVLAPLYGGGESDVAAANRARARYEQEQ
jgi:hypothetical protein